MRHMQEAQTWTCRCCGEVHEELPFSYGTDAPALWHDIPRWRRLWRCKLGGETCEMFGQHFFVRARILIPVHNYPHSFEWGAWVSLSRSNYERMLSLWSTPGREKEPPYSGWLSTALPYDPPTLSLKTVVHTRPVGERPVIELELTDHPLAIEQRSGITRERVQEMAEQLLHE